MCEYDLLTLTSSAGHMHYWPNERRWEILMGEEVWPWKHTHTCFRRLQVILGHALLYVWGAHSISNLIWDGLNSEKRSPAMNLRRAGCVTLVQMWSHGIWDITVPRVCMCVFKCDYEAVTWYRVRVFHLYYITDIELVFNPLNGFCILRDTDTWKLGGGTVSE